jgi:hypothetical protein
MAVDVAVSEGLHRSPVRAVSDVLLGRDAALNQILRDYIRWPATAIWFVTLLYQWVKYGVPIERETLILWIGTGLIFSTLGIRPTWTVIVDWLPFAAFLLVYDYSRGIAESIGMPTQWTPQITADRFLFAGHLPTAWLQQHFRRADPSWWEALTSLAYVSHFVVSFVVAGVLWLVNRTRWRQFAIRFVTLSFIGVLGYVLVPAAPPWAATRCTHAEVASHPANPDCLYYPQYDGAGQGALIPGFTPSDPLSQPSVERLTGRGLDEARLTSFREIIVKGQETVNYVAAVPSLHAGFSSLLLFFFWRRARWWVRPVLIAYPLLMAFSLVFTAEHYVVDILLGWLAAGLVCLAVGGVEKLVRRRARGRLARLSDRQSDGSTADEMSVQCQPTATTRLSVSASDGDSSSRPARSTAAPAPPGITARSA